MKQTTFTSPDTNKVYTIISSVSERGNWDENGNYAPVEFTQYSIYDNNYFVQFAFKEDEIAAAVEHYELPGPDVSSRFDWWCDPSNLSSWNSCSLLLFLPI